MPEFVDNLNFVLIFDLLNGLCNKFFNLFAFRAGNTNNFNRFYRHKNPLLC